MGGVPDKKMKEICISHLARDKCARIIRKEIRFTAEKSKLEMALQ